jgi:hypothetical protein
MTCIRDALVAHYAELAQRGEIPCAQVPILANLDINQLKGQLDRREVIDVLYSLWSTARFPSKPEFSEAMRAAAIVLRDHGKFGKIKRTSWLAHLKK